MMTPLLSVHWVTWGKLFLSILEQNYSLSWSSRNIEHTLLGLPIYTLLQCTYYDTKKWWLQQHTYVHLPQVRRFFYSTLHVTCNSAICSVSVNFPLYVCRWNLYYCLLCMFYDDATWLQCILVGTCDKCKQRLFHKYFLG